MDAACGPSNGIKSLQRHFDNDQSLHQSRIRQGQSNAQFRNAPTQEQLIQARQEQNAFLNGSRPEEFVRPGRPSGLSNDNWSQDFQKSLPTVQARPGPLFTAHQGPQPLLGQWGAEFLATTQQVPSQQQHQQHQYNIQNRFQESGFMGHPSMMQYSQTSSSSVLAPNIARETVAFHENFDMAFAEAEASLEESKQRDLNATRQMDQEEEADLVGMTSDQMRAYNQAEEMSFLEEAQESAMSNLETREQVDARFDGDALANTAGELIHSLRDESSQKFKNSNFMALMHKLRDREVVVDQGKMVDAISRQEVGNHQTRDIDALVSERNQLQDVVFD